MADKLPFVSIVVPAYNEELMLPSCLQALMAQDYKGKYEIIIIDNNSSDRTFKIAKIYGVSVFQEKRQGVSFARQKGFSLSRGELILTTDADTLVPTNWVTSMVKEFQKDRKIVAVGGGYDLIGTNTPLKLVYKSFAPLTYFMDKIILYPGTLMGCNFGVRRSAFFETGGFNLKLRPNEAGEDMDLGRRLKKIGKIKKVFKIMVKTSARRFTNVFMSLKYVFLNYYRFHFKKEPMPVAFETVREKPFESYDSINDLPLLVVTLVVCLSALAFLIGLVPSINLWSTSSAKTQDKVIALTFDTGSNAIYMKQLIEVLKEKGVKGSFFVTGDFAKNHPEVVKQAFNNGNVIGNFSMSTKSTLMLNSSKAIVNDIVSTDSIIFNIIGVKPKFFRPPHGYRSVWGALSLDKYGYDTVTWNNSGDIGIGRITSKKIAIDIIKDAKPGDIVDLQTTDQSVKATEEIIDLLEADGYHFVTLDTLLNKPAYF